MNDANHTDTIQTEIFIIKLLDGNMPVNASIIIKCQLKGKIRVVKSR